MAALRKIRSFYCLLRNSARFLTNGKPAVHKYANLILPGITSLALGSALCAVPFKQAEVLSHDALVRRAASLVTDSSSTFLSQTTLALIDALSEYSKAVHTLIALQKQYLASLEKLTPAEEDTVWQVILGQRAKVNEKFDDCKYFESTWITAVKLCETAAEAAYVSGTEQASVTVRSNIQLAQSQVEEARKLSLDAEKKLAETKVMEIERVMQHAASTQSSSDEEEIPEAYLRED